MQQVFCHSLTPLTTGLRTRQHIVEIGCLLGECIYGFVDIAESLHIHFTQALDLVIHQLYSSTNIVLDGLERSIDLFGATTQLLATCLRDTVGSQVDGVLTIALRALV